MTPPSSPRILCATSSIRPFFVINLGFAVVERVLERLVAPLGFVPTGTQTIGDRQTDRRRPDRPTGGEGRTLHPDIIPVTFRRRHLQIDLDPGFGRHLLIDLGHLEQPGQGIGV